MKTWKHISKQKGRAFVCAVLCAALLTSMMTVPVYAGKQTAYSDMEGHWAETYVKELLDMGVIHAHSNERFRPQDTILAGSYVAWIVNAKLDEDLLPQECWDYARDNGFLDLSLEYGETITRNMAAQIATLALDVLYEEERADDTLAQQLEDFASCHACRGYTSQCYVKGIMIGRTERVFSGEEILKRGEAAAIVMRVCDPSCRLVPEGDEEGPVLLSADAARRLAAADADTVILDVRNEEELSGGVIPGSICIPLAELERTNGNALSDHRTDIIIVYCQSGKRSAKAVKLLEENGFTQVYNLGSIDNWTYGLTKP